MLVEIYGQALQGRPHTAALLDGIVDAWLEPLTKLSIVRGMPPPQARAAARLGVVATRGLLLDLLATGDQAGAEEAMELFISLYEQLMPDTSS